MKKPHRLLERQIRRFIPDFVLRPKMEAQFRKFLEAVSTAYDDFDADRKLLEHSLELSSNELMTVNNEIQAIYQIAVRMHGDEPLSEIFPAALKEVISITQFPMASIKTLAPNGKYIYNAVYGGGAKGDQLLSQEVDGSQFPYVAEFEQGAASYYCDDLRKQDPRGPFAEHNVATLIAVPFFSGGGLAGHLAIAHTEPNRTTPSLLRWLQSVANVLGSEVEKRRLNKLNEEQKAAMLAATKMSELGKMAGGVAHEINTPLATILLLAQQLEAMAKKQELPEFDRKLKMIATTTMRIAAIVKSLKTISRDGSKDPMSPGDVASMVRQAVSLCSERFKHNLVDLRLDLIEDLHIMCRETQISQVLLNLLNNSFDAVSTLETRWILVKIQDFADYVEISVTDSGSGIAPEIREKMALPFFTTKPVGSGTGLGLSISTAIAKDHGGNLELDSACPNTRFIMRLPKGGIREDAA